MSSDINYNIEVGSKLYNWRYGSMTVKSIEGEYIILDIDDCDGISESDLILEPWKGHLNEMPKRFSKNSIDKWLFKVPDRVGSTKPAYGDKSVICDEMFLRKLHKSFDSQLVMECKNNFAAYLAKSKAAEKRITPKENEGYNSNNIKEIQELSEMREELEAKRLIKEDELEIASNKILDYDLQMKNIEGNISKYKKKISEKERRIIAKESEIDKIEAEANSNTYGKNQGIIIDIEAEIRRLEDGIEELKNEINEAGLKMEKISKEQGKLSIKKNQLSKEIQELRQKVENMEKDLQILV